MILKDRFVAHSHFENACRYTKYILYKSDKPSQKRFRWKVLACEIKQLVTSTKCYSTHKEIQVKLQKVVSTTDPWFVSYANLVPKKQ